MDNMTFIVIDGETPNKCKEIHNCKRSSQSQWKFDNQRDDKKVGKGKVSEKEAQNGLIHR